MKKLTLFSFGFLSTLTFSCSDNNTDTIDSTQTVQAVAMPTTEELQNDDDILWIGEVFVDCSPNYDKYISPESDKEIMKNIGFTERNTYKALKYQVVDLDKSDNDDHILACKILANKEHIDFYKDDKLSQKYSEVEKVKSIS